MTSEQPSDNDKRLTIGRQRFLVKHTEIGLPRGLPSPILLSMCAPFIRLTDGTAPGLTPWVTTSGGNTLI